MILMSYYVNTLTETFAKLPLPDLLYGEVLRGSGGGKGKLVSAKIAQQMPQGAVWHHEIFAALRTSEWRW